MNCDSNVLFTLCAALHSPVYACKYVTVTKIVSYMIASDREDQGHCSALFGKCHLNPDILEVQLKCKV